MEGAEDHLQAVCDAAESKVPLLYSSWMVFLVAPALLATYSIADPSAFMNSPSLLCTRGSYVFRYASLYFLVCVDPTDNELITLEIIHHFVELLDRYFGNVCELDLIFNFHKVR